MQLKKRVFVGCEGASERGYVRWLQNLADELDKNLAFDPHIVGGGDPLAVVEGSIKKLKHQTRKHGAYRRAAILLDSDRLGFTPARDAQIVKSTAGIAVILYQRYDHEAILLRHFPKCERLRPPAGKSLHRLLREWPDYRKPADALALSKKLHIEHLRRMLKVEKEFDAFFGTLLF